MIRVGTPVNKACSLCTMFEPDLHRILKVRYDTNLDGALAAHAKSKFVRSVMFSEIDFGHAETPDPQYDVLRLATRFHLEDYIPDSELVNGTFNGELAILHVDTNVVYY